MYRLLFVFTGFVWCSDFSTMAETYLMRDLEISISNIALVMTLINMPWFFRIPIGIVSDRIGYREAQLTFFFFFNALIFGFIAGFPKMPAPLVCTLLGLIEFGSACTLSIADSLMVVQNRANDLMTTRSIRARIIGGMAADLISGFVLQKTNDIYLIFLIDSVSNALMGLYMLVFFMMFPARYEQVMTTEDVETKELPQSTTLVQLIKKTVFTPSTLRSVILMMIFMSSIPDSGGATTYFYIGPAGYTPAMFGVLGVLVHIFRFVGTLVRFSTLKSMFLFWSAMGNLVNIPVLLVITRLSMLVVDDFILTCAVTAIMSFVGSAANIVFVSVASKASPNEQEGLAFSVFVTLPLLGQGIGIITTYILTNYFDVNHDNFGQLPQFSSLCAILFLTTLVPPFYIYDEKK